MLFPRMFVSVELPKKSEARSSTVGVKRQVKREVVVW